MVEVKTAELTGPALDWAVAVATQRECRVARYVTFGTANVCVEAGVGESLAMQRGPFCPSTDWARGGPLLDKYDVWLSSDGDCHSASTHPHVNEYIATGPTKLIALCRAIVVAKLGDVVQVPAELVA